MFLAAKDMENSKAMMVRSNCVAHFSPVPTSRARSVRYGGGLLDEYNTNNWNNISKLLEQAHGFVHA